METVSLYFRTSHKNGDELLGITVGVRSRNYATAPLIQVQRYNSRTTAAHELEYTVPIDISYKAFMDSPISVIRAPTVRHIGQHAFSRCHYLSDLSELGITSDTIIDPYAFLGIGDSDDVEVIRIPAMTKYQLIRSGICIDTQDRNCMRNDVYFCPPDIATADILVDLAVPVQYPDGRRVGLTPKEIRKTIEDAVASMDAVGMTRVTVGGTTICLCDPYNASAKTSTVDGDKVYVPSPFFDAVKTADLIIYDNPDLLVPNNHLNDMTTYIMGSKYFKYDPPWYDDYLRRERDAEDQRLLRANSKSNE